MAIDSTLYVADIPAGSYNAGDIIPLTVNAGPANVRSGRGSAKLKSIIVGSTGTTLFVRIHVKNSDWIDEVVSIAGNVNNATSFAEDSGNVQQGSDCELVPNSAWQIYGEVLNTVTTTGPVSIFTLIDIDYPAVSAVANPADLVGTPMSIIMDETVTPVAYGSLTGAMWAVHNVDYFKAGYKYCLKAIETYASSNVLFFVAFSNAAGMGGLTRIIPSNNISYSLRKNVSYASILVKGPMDVKVLALANAATPVNLVMVHDYVKRSA